MLINVFVGLEGMTQIFRVDNPMLGRGLTFPQRLCYLNAMMHFQYGLPRIIFLTAPLLFMLFNPQYYRLFCQYDFLPLHYHI